MKITAQSCFEISVNTNLTTECRVTEDLDSGQHRWENLGCRTFLACSNVASCSHTSPYFLRFIINYRNFCPVRINSWNTKYIVVRTNTLLGWYMSRAWICNGYCLKERTHNGYHLMLHFSETPIHKLHVGYRKYVYFVNIYDFCSKRLHDEWACK